MPKRAAVGAALGSPLCWRVASWLASARVLSALLTMRRTSSLSKGLLERLDGGVHGAVGGEDDDGQAGLLTERGSQQIHAAELRHPQVGDHHVHVVLSEEGEGRLAVLGRVHLVAVATELGGEDASEVGLVVDDEDLFGVREHRGREAQS